MVKEATKPFGYGALTPIPTGFRYAIGELLFDQPVFVYSGLGMAVPGAVLAVVHL